MYTIPISYTEVTLYITTDYLSLNDLGKVQNSIWDAHGKWYNLGLGLNITPDILNTIKQDNAHKTEDCFTAMLTQWLREHRQPTWRALAEALSSRSVGYGHLAEQILQESEGCDPAQ